MLEMFAAPIARSFSTANENEHENEGEIRPSPIILPVT